MVSFVSSFQQIGLVALQKTIYFLQNPLPLRKEGKPAKKFEYPKTLYLIIEIDGVLFLEPKRKKERLAKSWY